MSAIGYDPDLAGAGRFRRNLRGAGPAPLCGRLRVRVGRVGSASSDTRSAAPGFDPARFCGAAAFAFAARVLSGRAG